MQRPPGYSQLLSGPPAGCPNNRSGPSPEFAIGRRGAARILLIPGHIVGLSSSLSPPANRSPPSHSRVCDRTPCHRNFPLITKDLVASFQPPAFSQSVSPGIENPNFHFWCSPTKGSLTSTNPSDLIRKASGHEQALLARIALPRTRQTPERRRNGGLGRLQSNSIGRLGYCQYNNICLAARWLAGRISSRSGRHAKMRPQMQDSAVRRPELCHTRPAAGDRGGRRTLLKAAGKRGEGCGAAATV